MAFKTFTAGSVLTAAEVNDYLMKQAVIVCTAATRPSAPVEGMVIYETDTNKMLAYTGTDWAPRDAGGQLGYAQVVASQGSITTETDLTSLSTAVTVGAGRRVRITGYTQPQTTVALDTALLRIKEGAGVLTEAVGDLRTSGRVFTLISMIVLSPSAGAHTYKLSMQRLDGSGTITSVAAATQPAWILVEDIGAA